MVNHPNIPQDNGFLTSLHQLEGLFNKEGCKSRFTGSTLADLTAWQQEKRAILHNLLGFDTFADCGNKVYELESEDCGTYTRTKYVLQTEEFVHMPFLMLKPKDAKAGEPLPAILCPNGHFKNFKESVAAVRTAPNVLIDMEEFHTHHGEDFVNMGYMAFCPDARGYGERAERAVQREGAWKCSCTYLNRMGIPLGRSTLGMNIWDLIKLTDYVCGREDVDASRIGAAGLSGGGFQSMFLAAADERIKCICTSGYFYGALLSLLHMNQNCDCNYVPNLWRHFDHGDIAALIAPRALIIETGIQDTLNGAPALENITPQLAITQQAYAAANAPENIRHVSFDVGHKWVGTETYPFFEKHLPLN
jgi:hypothetical protein